MRFFSFEVVIEKEPEDEGYNAYSPSLPGCFSNGRTIEEAKRNMRDCEVNLWGAHNVLKQGIHAGAFAPRTHGVIILSTSATAARRAARAPPTRRPKAVSSTS